MSRSLASATGSPNATPCPLSMQKSQADHTFSPRPQLNGRSPCPALNTLANHGYIQRDGLDIGFSELIGALRLVYNISFPLALILTSVGFMKSAKFTFGTLSIPTASNPWCAGFQRHVPLPRWKLDLASLSIRGSAKIAHDGSLVHPDGVPSHAPDKGLLARLLALTCHHEECHLSGVSLSALAHLHASRTAQLLHPLNHFHEKVALGECGLAWAVMSRRGEFDVPEEGVITERTIETWFGREQLPEDWWGEGGARPIHTVGLFEAKRRADDVAKLMRT